MIARVGHTRASGEPAFMRELASSIVYCAPSLKPRSTNASHSIRYAISLRVL
jgi:hypothetical protein